LGLLDNPSIVANRAALLDALESSSNQPDPSAGFKDNPDIQDPPLQAAGSDPMLQKAWGIFAIGADKAWKRTPQGKDIVVAITDTGVDYNHEDLIANMWRNKGEIPNNNIDDDKNGFVDDIVGWDFRSNDNKPYDLSMSLLDILLKGGNPGHGTHCAGVAGARLNNGLGTAGVAPQVRIMAVRFIGEDGKGSDKDAIRSIDYAIKNGANIISASWGGEAGDEEDKALKDAIQRAQDKGVLFIAAAGNGRMNPKTMKQAGFDNDKDKKPIVPASFPMDNIIAVAAVDSRERLASFSNWGKKSVKLGAPGVKVLSTVPGNRYQDTIIDMGGIKATWDGTSMAAPFVAGSAAVIWSQNKTQTWQEVKAKLLASTLAIDSLRGKVATDGRIDLKKLGR
jgi:subtilisin family serine protease